MVGPFNCCKVDVAMLGNHDLDFGVRQMRACIANTITGEFIPKVAYEKSRIKLPGNTPAPNNCRWLLSNITYPSKPHEGLGGLLRTSIIE